MILALQFTQRSLSLSMINRKRRLALKNLTSSLGSFLSLNISQTTKNSNRKINKKTKSKSCCVNNRQFHQNYSSHHICKQRRHNLTVVSRFLKNKLLIRSRKRSQCNMMTVINHLNNQELRNRLLLLQLKRNPSKRKYLILRIWTF